MVAGGRRALDARRLLAIDRGPLKKGCVVPRLGTHVTARTSFVETNGLRLAFRRLGREGGLPLILLQHFRGNMDNWDPAVVDGLAADRPVILFDNRGIGRSSGVTPDNITDMASDAIAFIEALELPRVDVLGFSLGGMIAQQMLFDHSSRIRRAILVGTGGPGAAGMFNPEVTMAAAKYPGDGDSLLFLFFAPTTASQAAGGRYLQRMMTRVDREPATTRETIQAHLAAIRAWGETNGEVFAHLKRIEQSVLVVNGTHDIMIPSFNAYALSQQIPSAQLILYPDAGHGSLFQYPEWFVHDALRFLERDCGRDD
jgi:pimeloyl-ACP methyl ester carboxylesterase